MINPDLLNINLIPDSSLSMISIDNTGRINDENKFLKASLALIAFAVIAIAIRNYMIDKKESKLL